MKAIAKGIVGGIALSKTRKDAATKTIAKWLRSNDREVLDEVYREVSEKSLSAKPYPTTAGIQLLLNELASQEPQFARSRPGEFIDTDVLRVLDKSGFIDALYR